MKFYPILFSTEMVKAILEGRKSQTRRVVKMRDGSLMEDEDLSKHMDGSFDKVMDFTKTFPFYQKLKCPYGEVGDVLWVRENWQLAGWDFEDGFMSIRYEDGKEEECDVFDPTEDSMWLLNQVLNLETKGIIKQDPEDEERLVFTGKKQPFKPSIHMPKAACRIFLQIKNIRVERIHDITTDDVRSEGVKYPVIDNGDGSATPVFNISEKFTALDFMPENYKQLNKDELSDALLYAHFALLWSSINGLESWNSNPWVWAIEFERIEKPKNFC